MTPQALVSRVERLAPWIGGFSVALPVMLVSFPPMSDLPLHEASIALLRHWNDRTFCPHDIYFVNLGHANQLFSLVVWALSYLLPIAWATKTVVALTLFLLPVAAAHFADYLRAPRWTALLVAPLGLGWLFFWGLIQNLVGLAILLALLPTIDRFAESPTPRGIAKMCAAFTLLHFAHEAMQIAACIVLAASSLGAPLRLRETAIRAAPVLFTGATVYAENRYSWSLAGPRHQATWAYRWDTPLHKIVDIPGVLFAGYEPYVRYLVFLLVLVPVALLLAERIRVRAGTVRTCRERVHGVRFEIFALVMFAGYMLAPESVKSTTLVYHRFLPPTWAVFAVSCAAGTAATARALPRLLCAFAPVASLLIGWPTFADADRMYADLDKLMPLVDKGSTVMALDLGPIPTARLWGPMAAMGHVVALKGGRSLYDYTQSPVSPVAQRPKKQWPEAITRMETNPLNLTPSWDMLRYRYLLIATPSPGLGFATALAVRNEATLIGRAGDWYLFESRILSIPVNGHESWPPTPHPPTLKMQLNQVSKELDAIESAGTLAGM